MSDEAETADEPLMLAYAAGNVRAFETLYDRHGLRIWRYIFRSVRDHATADDLAQDVWFSVARQAARYEPRARFTTWVFSIAHNRVVDHFRASGRPMISLDADDEASERLADRLFADSGWGPLRRIESRQQAEQLFAALAALPAVQRDALLLQAEGDLSLAEIAEATGCGIETVKSRLRYARSSLRKTLEGMA